MFAIPGLLLLLLFIYIRPHEIVPALQGVPFLYAFVALTLVGLALDLRLRVVQPRWSALLVVGTLHALWSSATAMVSGSAMAVREVILTMVSLFLFVALSQAVQTFRALKSITTFVLALSLVLSAVAVHQAFAPQGCVKQDDEGPASNIWVPDGRSCEKREHCYETSLEQNMRYRCERIGLWGTTSIDGRVRYRGIMEDPNELALVTSIGIPFVFALFQLGRTSPRLFLAVFTVGLIGLSTILTKSRSGQLAFLAVVGVYLFKRVGWRGVAAAGVLGAPVMLLGGRKDAAASASSLERLDCWQAGFEMFRGSPLWGVGKGQFTEHHYLTAHNSIMLQLAEGGAVGVFLWTALVYLAFKTLLQITREALPVEGRVAQIWGTALLSSITGLMISAMFLSFSDHNIFWIFMGLVGAAASCTARHRPGWRVPFTARDAAIVVALDVVVVGAIFVYTRVGYG